jgi:hypothetical protein
MSARVSVFARLVPALSFMIAALGAVPSSLYIRNVLWAMQDAGSAGIAAVAGGIAEGNLFVLVALYLAIFCGFPGILVFVIRLLMETKTVSPSSWFFVVAAVLGLLPALLLWTAESLLIGVVANHSGIMRVANPINWLSIMSMIVALFSILLLLAGSVWPLASQSKRKWGPLVALVLVNLLLIVVAVAFQVRYSWLYQVKELERF